MACGNVDPFVCFVLLIEDKMLLIKKIPAFHEAGSGHFSYY
ncbi:MAG: hypothetical protein K0S23_3158 [Fluviicola sp.]|jgi:hypothetical protein|nr:hypothetical protein [Fluviicola sp.]